MSETHAAASFPPEPWRLSGALWASAWLIPAADLPAFDAPPGWRPLRIAGRLTVGAVWGRYAGDLRYAELAVGVLLRRGLGLAVTLPWIWVDSPASLAGGRALWAIPKQLAGFSEAGSLRAEGPDGELAAMAFAPRLALPGRRRLVFRIVQSRGGRSVETPACIDAAWRLGRARWRGAGGLRALTRRPLLSLRLEPAEMTFGRPLPARRRNLH